MRERWNERRWDCTKRRGASNIPNAGVWRIAEEGRLRAAFVFAVSYSGGSETGVAMIKVGIVGGTGYTGIELLRILAGHPESEIVAITSRKEAGIPVAELFPSLRGVVDLVYADPAKANLGKCDVVFFATPNTVAMCEAKALVEGGVRVVDL